MSNLHHDERERLEREANLVRARLATTLEVLDKRGHDLVDVKLQLRRHAVPIAIVAGTVVLAVASGLGYAIYRVATRTERIRRERRRLASRVWNHPERVAQTQKPPVLLEIGRKLLVGTVALLGMSLIRRAIDVPMSKRPRSAMNGVDAHHIRLGDIVD